MKRIVYICLIFSEQRIRHSHYQNLLKLCSTTSPFPCLPRLALCLYLLGVFMFALRKCIDAHSDICCFASCCRARLRFSPPNRPNPCPYPCPLQLCNSRLNCVLAAAASGILLDRGLAGCHVSPRGSFRLPSRRAWALSHRVVLSEWRRGDLFPVRQPWWRACDEKRHS